MKDSGIEWLGKIPAHWEVKRLKCLFKNLDHRRIPLSAEERSYMEKKYPYYGASGMIDSVENFIFDEPLILVAEDGANLLSRSTPLAFIAEGKYWVNNHAHILKPLSGPLSFWEGVLRTYDYTPLITGAAQPKLTAENLGSIPLPVPAENECCAIAAFLDRETARIDALIEEVEKSIDLLREYRTALISAAVTGKIDVRNLPKPVST
jgi:type I restriction enzyme S subunit